MRSPVRLRGKTTRASPAQRRGSAVHRPRLRTGSNKSWFTCALAAHHAATPNRQLYPNSILAECKTLRNRPVRPVRCASATLVHILLVTIRIAGAGCLGADLRSAGRRLRRIFRVINHPMNNGGENRTGNDTFERAWRNRFEEFASIRDDDAGIAGWSPAGLDARMRRFAELWLPGQSGVRWLDAGCGAGTYTRHLFAHGMDVAGVDYSLPAIQKARTRSPQAIPFAVADVRHLPFRPDTFDGVLCFGVTQALGESESALTELCLLTRPGGELWVDALNGRFVINTARVLARKLRRRPAHLRYESPRKLERILRAHGFRDISLFWMPIAPSRLPRLQRLVETRSLRWMMRIVPLLGMLISHSFIIRGTKRAVDSTAQGTPV